MPTTPSLGLPYPALTDPPNGPSQMQALAEATETAITATTSSTTGVTALSGWSINNSWLFLSHNLCVAHISVAKTGADLVAAPSGNVADTDICTLPIGFRPPWNITGIIGNGLAHGEVLVATNGIVTVRAWLPDQGFQTPSDTIRISATFPVE